MNGLTTEVQLARSSWGQTVLEQAPFVEPPPAGADAPPSSGLPFSQTDVVSRVTATFSSLFSSVSSAIANLIFFLFVGSFLAAGLRSYRTGIIAGVAELIPFFGPFLAAVRAILLAFFGGALAGALGHAALPPYPAVGRQRHFGYAAKGVVYVTIGLLATGAAFNIAGGTTQGPENPRRALARPLGVGRCRHRPRRLWSLRHGAGAVSADVYRRLDKVRLLVDSKGFFSVRL